MWASCSLPRTLACSGAAHRRDRLQDNPGGFPAAAELAGKGWGVSPHLEAANHVGSSLPKREELHFSISLHSFLCIQNLFCSSHNVAQSLNSWKNRSICNDTVIFYTTSGAVLQGFALLYYLNHSLGKGSSLLCVNEH